MDIGTTIVPLLTSVDCTDVVHLVIGDNGIAAKRVNRSLEAGATCILMSPAAFGDLHIELRDLIKSGKLEFQCKEFYDDALTCLGREEINNVVDMVFVTLSPLDERGISQQLDQQTNDCSPSYFFIVQTSANTGQLRRPPRISPPPLPTRPPVSRSTANAK